MPFESKYKEKYCQEVVDFMSQGYSFEAFAGHISVSKVTLYNWAERYPEFKEAKDIGFARSQKLWEGIGIEGAMGKLAGFNSASYIFNMKNRFKWRDRTEHSMANEESLITIKYDPES